MHVISSYVVKPFLDIGMVCQQPTPHHLAISKSKVSRESSDTTLAGVALCPTNKEREAVARFISVVTLVVIVSGVAVALALPVLPFFLRDTDNTGHANSVRICTMIAFSMKSFQ